MRKRHLLQFLVVALLLSLVWPRARADSLADIRARGELRHLGIRYANFVTGNDDGFDVELVRSYQILLSQALQKVVWISMTMKLL